MPGARPWRVWPPCGWVEAGGRPSHKRRSRRSTETAHGDPRPRPSAPAPTADRPVRQFRPDPRLALTVAFISGLTSLGYQVTWTRLLASGTGNTTYVFTTILATFLIGIALGAVLFAVLRTRLGDPVRLLAASQVIAAALAIAGLVFVLVQPHAPTPGKPIETLQALLGTSLFVVLPVTIALGIAFPASSALLEDDGSHAGRGSGGLLATNTVGAILGSLVVPFVLIPLLGSPVLVAVLALVNACFGIALGWGRVARPTGRWIAATGSWSSRRSSSSRRCARASWSSRTRRTSRRQAAGCSTPPRTRSPRSRRARSASRRSCGSPGHR